MSILYTETQDYPRRGLTHLEARCDACGMKVASEAPLHLVEAARRITEEATRQHAKECKGKPEGESE